MIDLQAARFELLEWVAESIQVSVDDINLTKPLAEVGLDSLDAVHMIATIESLIQMDLPEDIIKRVNCLNDILEMMRQKVVAA
ncbi:MAG: acyl carrier protein [Phycisphaerae bacterium]